MNIEIVSQLNKHFLILIYIYLKEWYSTESYFIVKTTIDSVINLVIIVGFAAIVSTKYDKSDTFGSFLLVFGLSALSYQSLGQIFAIVFGEYALIASILLSSVFLIFQGVLNRDLSEFVYNLLHLVPMKQMDSHMILLFYGGNICPENQVSSVIYKYNLVDDDFDSTTHLLIFDAIFYYILCYICLKLYVNWDSIQIQIKSFKQRLFN